MPTSLASCFAQYQGDDHCGSCPQLMVCVSATIEADGYYDELAERERYEEEFWRYGEEEEHVR